MKIIKILHNRLVIILSVTLIHLEAYTPFFGDGFRLDEFFDRAYQGYDLFVMFCKMSFNPGNFSRQFLVLRNHDPEFYKGSDDVDTRFCGPGGIEHAGRHDRTMLGECKRLCFRIFQSGKVVAFCDQFRFFFRGELKHEVFGETAPVAFDLLIQPFGGYSVKLCQVGVDDYFFAADHQYAVFYFSGRNNGFLGHYFCPLNVKVIPGDELKM